MFKNIGMFGSKMRTFLLKLFFDHF